MEIMTQTFRLKKLFHLSFDSKVSGPLSIKKPLRSVTIILEWQLGFIGSWNENPKLFRILKKKTKTKNK